MKTVPKQKSRVRGYFGNTVLKKRPDVKCILCARMGSLKLIKDNKWKCDRAGKTINHLREKHKCVEYIYYK
jgi:hypothetical protein